MADQNSLLNKRVKIFLNYVIGPLLFVWVIYSLYKAVQEQEDLQQSWDFIVASVTGVNTWKIILVFVLMFLNWGIEARKWQVLVRFIEKISLLRAFKAVFSGQSLAVNTPNRLGEYVGRVVYLQEGNRLRGISLTIVGSLSQLLVTFVAGAIGMWAMKPLVTESILKVLEQTGLLKKFPGLGPIAFDFVFFGVLIVIILILLVYYELSWLTRIIERLPLIRRYKYLIEKLEELHVVELTRILSLSLTRYVVFMLQFILLLQVFGVEIPFWDAAGLVSVFFLLLAIVPTVSSVELSIRGLASMALFGMMSTNTLGIIATTAGIWLINLMIPALAGGLFIAGIKLFKK